MFNKSIASATAMTAAGLRWRAPKRVQRYSPNGARECARRMRQIAVRSLKKENGLYIPPAPIAEKPKRKRAPRKSAAA